MDHSGMGEPYEEDLESDKDFSDTDKGSPDEQRKHDSPCHKQVQ